MAEAVDATVIEDAVPARRRGKGLLIGALAALALGGGGFYAAWSGLVDPAGLIGGGEDSGHGSGHDAAAALSFVPLEPIMISLPPGASARHLRFSAQLEVEPDMAAEVAAMSPRIVDTLNAYLRAVDAQDLENPAALQRLRAQMLRRIQVVTGPGRVRDLLIAEFILN